MQIYIPESLQYLASKLNNKLYLVGGTVRDSLLGFKQSYDFDLASSILADEFCRIATDCNMQIKALYKHTGTVQFTDGEFTYEYTTFRKDSYRHGEHKPATVTFINDIEQDALRRDFKCNAIYYDISQMELCDPLDGQVDIKNKVLTTTRDAESVFEEDGLRLMRLARFAATLGFEADLSTIFAAKFNAARIQNIAPERIFTELQAILHADCKNNIPEAHYIGLKILEGIDIFQYILPELAQGKEMMQNKNFHTHDVLEHSLRTCKYAHPSVRLAGLLHDVGKPKQKLETGKFHGHDQVGEKLVVEILTRLKAPNTIVEECRQLTAMHMFDLEGNLSIEILRKFFVEHYPLLQKLFYLRQADFSAGKDDLSICPTILKWQSILQEMQMEGVPFSLKELQIDGNLLKPFVKDRKNIGILLNKLLTFCTSNGRRNTTEQLLQQAKIFAKSL